MIIGFTYVNKEEGNKDSYKLPVGRIRTNRFLLQQARFRSDIGKSFLTIRVARCWKTKIICTFGFF